MKKLKIVIALIMSIACCAPLISKAQTVPVPSEKLRSLLRQRDSLHVAQREITDLSQLVQIQQQRLAQKDSIAADQSTASTLQQMLVSTLRDENQQINNKFTVANNQVTSLNRQLRRQRTKTKILGITGVAAVVAAFLLGSRL